MEQNLRKLKREQLLELLFEQQVKIEEQEEIILELKQKLDDKNIILEKSGSIAEAALKLNKVFEVAQDAANQYLESVKEKCQNEVEK